MTVPDAVLWRAVENTLRDVLVPALPPGAALDTAVQLQGLAAWAGSRGDAPPGDRLGELATALGVDRPADLADALALASAALLAGGAPAADVRPLLLRHAEQDAAAAAPLLETFAGHPARDELPTPTPVPGPELTALVARLQAELGGPLHVERAHVLSGGHSRRMLRLDVAGPGGLEQLVVRIEQGGTFGTDGTLEAEVVRAVAAAGLPAPRVRLVEPDAAPLGQPFFVMDLVPGTSTVDEAVLEEFLRVLDRVHRDGPAAVRDVLGPAPDPEHAVQAQVDRWEGVYRASVPHTVPLLDEAAGWLRRHLRATGPVALVHGDPGPGNFLSQHGRITALTDWEFVHLGDAAEDWSYFATLRSRKVMPAQQWYAVLERVVRVSLDDATWRAWEAFNQYKGACANLTALRLFRDGVGTAPSLLAIGTAVHTRFLRRLAELTAD